MIALRLLWREFVSGQLTLLALAIVVSVAAMTTTEVLTDRIDEWMITRLSRFGEKNLVSITQSKMDDDVDLQVEESIKESMSDIIDRLKAYYADRVKDVVLTKKLSQSNRN